MRVIRAATISLSLFALMMLFDYASENSLEESIKLNLIWGLITGFGIEYLYPFVANYFSTKKNR